MIRALTAVILILWAAVAVAQDFTSLARPEAAQSGIEDTRRGVRLELALSQGVPYRVFTLDVPRRLVLDFREVDWQGLTARDLDRSDRVEDVRVGTFYPGWSRMVVDLGGPFLLQSAAMHMSGDSGKARLEVILTPGSASDFAAQSGAPDLPGWHNQEAGTRALKRPRQRGEHPLMVVLDPGHGGIDPGAERDGAAEKTLMLTFARELKETLIRAGGFEVTLTRDEDRFVSLERRVSLAHKAGADVFLSLHADMLSEGRARGATVYTLSDTASDDASAALAERHSRGDILAGIDLTGQDDVIADVLMDLARMETQPRAERLAEALVLGLREHEIPLHSRPLRSAGFSVLKSPDIPSILLELGFLSNEGDLSNLLDSDWRARMAAGIRDALVAWRLADAAAADLVRQ